MKKYLLFVACFFTLNSTLYSQNLEWRVVPDITTSPNNVRLTFEVRSSGLPFYLGPTSLVVDIPASSRGCINGSAATLASTGLIISTNSGAYSTPAVAASGTSSRVGVTVYANGNTAPLTGQQVDATYRTLAVINVPISDCNCAVTDFSLTASSITASSATRYVSPTYPTATGGTFPLAGATVTTSNVNITPPTITTPAVTTWYLCNGVDASTRTFNVSATGSTTLNYFWNIRSAVGSRFAPNSLTASGPTVSLRLGANVPAAPGVNNPSKDTIFVSAVNGSSCYGIQVIDINPAPSVGYTLVPLGSTNQIAGVGSLQFKLSGSQPNVRYTLLRQDVLGGAVTTVETITAPPTGGEITFTTLNAFPVAGTPIFTYRADPPAGAVDATCTSQLAREQGVPVNVITTALPAFSIGAPVPAGPYCTLPQSLVLTPTTAGLPTNTIFTWSVDDPSVTFVNRNISSASVPSIGLKLGYSTTNSTVTVTCLGQSVQAGGTILTRVVTTTFNIQRIGRTDVAGPASINGPANVFYDGSASLSLNYTIPVTSGTGTWSYKEIVSGTTVPGITMGALTGVLDITTPTAPLTGTYTIQYSNTLAPCGPQMYTTSLVVGDCNASPGNPGVAQTICAGNSGAVYTTGTPVGTLQWQSSATPTGPWTNETGIGANGQVFFASNVLSTTYYRLVATGTQLGTGSSCTVPSSPIQLNVQTQPVAGVVTIPTTFQSKNVCVAGTVQLTIAGANGNIEWQQSPNGASWVTASGIVYADSFRTALITSTTYYRARIYNGCSEVFTNADVVEVGRLPNPSIITLTNQTVCENTNFTVDATLDAANGEAGLWTTSSTVVGSTFTFVGNPVAGQTQYVYRPAIGEAAQSPTRLTWTVTSGSCTPVSRFIDINVNPGPVGIISNGWSPGASFCRGATTPQIVVNIVAGNDPGVWDDGGKGGTFIPNVNAKVVQYKVNNAAIASDVITLRYTITSSGCAAPATPTTIPFTVDPGIVTATWGQATSTDVCFGSTITLDNIALGVNTSGFFSWPSTNGYILPNFFSGGTTTYNNPSNPIPSTLIFVPTAIGSFTMSYYYYNFAGCSNFYRIDRQFNVLPQPTATISNNLVSYVCSNTNPASSTPVPGRITLRGNVTPLTAVGTWSIANAGDGVPVSNATNFLPNPNDPDARFQPNPSDSNKTFRINWIASLTGTGCANNATSVTLTVFGVPFGGINGDTTRNLAAASIQPAICAGTASISLTGNFGGAENSKMLGRWRTKDTLGLVAGGGSFNVSGARGEIASYQTNLNDRNKAIALIWEVYNLGGCGSSKTYVRRLQVQNVAVNATFVPAGQPGGQNQPLTTLCSNTLQTIALGGTTGRGLLETPDTRWAQTGGTGTFFPSITDSNAVYVFGANDTLVSITWRVSIGACDTVKITRPLRISRLPQGNQTQVQIICAPAGSDTLRAVKLPSMLGQGTGAWQIVSGTGLISNLPINPAVPDSNKAIYIPGTADQGNTVTLRYRVSNSPCTDYTGNMSVFVAGPNVFTLNGPATAVCAGDVANLNVTGTADIFQWIVPGSVLSAQISPDTKSIQITASDTLDISVLGIYNDPNGLSPVPCSYLKTFRVNTLSGSGLTALGRIIRVPPDPYTTSLGVCNNTDIQLTMTPTTAFSNSPQPTGFLWTFDDGSAIPSVYFNPPSTANSQTISLKLPQRVLPYTFLARARTTLNNCFSFDAISVSVTTGQAPVFASPYTLCQDPTGVNIISPTNLAAILPGSISRTWLTPAGVTMTSYPTINSVPSAELDTVFVVNEELYVNLANVRDTVKFSYVLKTSSCDIPVTVAFSVTAPPATAFLAFRDGADSIRTVKSFPYPVDGTGSPLINDTTIVSLATYAGLVTFRSPVITDVFYTWDFGDPTPQPDTSGLATNLNSNNATGNLVRHFYGKEGRYTVVLYAQNNLTSCADFGTATNIIEIRPPEFFFPTAFTPNGDGRNDLFQALPLEANPLVLSLQVFDRNGQVVYQTGGYTSPLAGQRRSYGWDGTNGTSAKLDPGMYTYRATIEVVPGTNKDYVGTVTLIR